MPSMKADQQLWLCCNARVGELDRNLVLDNSSQTVYSKFELSEKVETMTLKNEEFFKRPSQSNIALGYFITFSTCFLCA